MQLFNYPIIDAHIHPYTIPDRKKIFAPPNDLDELFAELDRAGVNIACGSYSIRNDGSDYGIVEKCNQKVLKIWRDYPDKFIPGIIIHPNFPEKSVEIIEMMREYGLRWIGELSWYVMGYEFYAAPGLRKALELATEYQMVLNVHPSTEDDMENLLASYPELNIVIAHPESFRGITSIYGLMEKYSNAYLDLSGSGLFRWGMLRAGIDRLGVERFLFGTDFPICSAGMNVQGVLCEKLNDSERKAVFHDNFMRLINHRYPEKN